MTHDLTLLPEVDARALLHAEERTLCERLLLPPYPAVGLGRLRVLQVRTLPGCTELLCSYEGYERL